nr:nucleotide exchange factor GrpE [Bacteroidota bacterium]
MVENKNKIESEDTENEKKTLENMDSKMGAGSGKQTVGKKKSKSKKIKNEVTDYQEKIDELESNLAELNDKYLRLFSEFDNYRKRTMREHLELIKNASRELITDLLPVLDDFERAIKSMGANGDFDKITEGILLIYNKFKNILIRKGLEEIKALGEVFDTDFHEAITNIPAPSEDLKGKVVDEIEKGYLLNGKVIRFTKVVVGQ